MIMKKSIYAVYDKVAEVFNNPFTELNDESAKRAFTAHAETQMFKDDYVLYKLGDLNDSSGEIVSDGPEKILAGLEVKMAEQNIPEMVQQQAI